MAEGHGRCRWAEEMLLLTGQRGIAAAGWEMVAVRDVRAMRIRQAEPLDWSNLSDNHGCHAVVKARGCVSVRTITMSTCQDTIRLTLQTKMHHVRKTAQHRTHQAGMHHEIQIAGHQKTHQTESTRTTCESERQHISRELSQNSTFFRITKKIISLNMQH